GTTTIDAARIGSGLTDAQVNDNLTINGGTVDATPIGATTPSTGAFTTITGTALPSGSTSTDLVTSNGGALETRTVASLGGSIAVSTDATLTGDGTTGNPLGIDLTNANTWTATQTLPVTAAQGDALIASTNAGTTTIDAARIGAGLTDAQVNDNLTINGGTVDATPIGATTPSTGAFTTITGTTITGTALPSGSTSTDLVTSNGGALETRTVASLGGSIAVSTDATLTGDGTTGNPLGIDLTNANTWTGTQTLPVTAAQGDALIASTNAGTTTIDAARIGAGLTDAQVNDNLTINGGTVDATPIGATTPSTGAFTTITGTALPAASTSTDLVTSNGGALETRTIASLAGSIAVSTDATLIGDGTTGNPLGLNLTNANSWTGGQTFSSVDINGGTIDGTDIGGVTPATGTFTVISDGAGSTITGGTVTASTLTDGIASMSAGTISDGFGATMAGGTVTGLTLTDGIASMSAGTISDGFGASLNGGTVTGFTLTDGTALMSGGTISDGAGSTITGGAGTFATITGTALPAASTSTDIVTSNGGALETRTIASLGGSIAVSTDATLTGDGTTGDPLGIDLTNANTWTGTQTLPVTAAQGDALIASTNAGTTTIDAARIGAGLTDAQVNDNLTINGGTVDATPIGATTPSTGAFTTIAGSALPSGSTSTDLVVSNGGDLETRTVASLGGNVAVTTNSTLLGDGTTGDPLRINLSNTNTWTGTQTFGQVSVLSIATFDADVTLGDSPTDAITVNGTLAGATPLSFEGATSDVNETTFAITDPTADRTITFQDASGTVAFLSDLGVTTNSTLLGDGSGGDPLRINLSNANTWTGAQTFGQVAVLSIATFDADVTLGDSPTDAITVNGTLAGATPLSFEGATSDVNETTFAITDPTADRTITFQDASGTVAFLSDIAVTTNSTLLGDGTGGDPLRINLSNANTWTGTQTFGQVAVLSIATFDADVTLGDSPTDAITVNGTLAGATPLSFEGATSDVNETTFAITDPTADRTITFQDASGTVAFLNDIAVTTNSTLLGDGSGGDPLRINLSNANTWTATQTLPVTAAQGDALIASTNAGTTTIDAARIGSGLTDAQVNDNLTINGGTVDATPIGATTPSTGAFTTITGTTLPSGSTSTDLVTSNGGALETRTVASLGGSIAVSTDATLTGDGTTGNPLGIDLTNANTWTATQTLPVTAAQGDALIASTNAGTTTIDAARIGSGLTDAQVNDNLTINGGTVDATPIGGTTPSTGVFTQATINSAGGTDLVITETGVDRSSGSAETFAIDNSGAGNASLVVNTTTGVTNSRIVVNEGHWTSRGTAPTAAGDGTNLAAAVTVSTTSTDVAGFVTSTDGGAVGIGVITVTFNAAYATDPIVVVTPGDAATAGAGFFVNNIGTTSFDINLASTLGDGTTTYSFYYQVIEND
ncbi:MAG: beta strand repeat-containing protein, partial [Candidatus Kapaibacterium sp.]